MSEHDYSIEAWKGFKEDFILTCLEKTYKRLFYKVTNYHRDERRNEEGIDLLCEKNDEKIAIQLKKRPRKSDIDQFNIFKNIEDVTNKIYVYVQNPTKPFKKHIMENFDDVEIWDNKILHDFLILNESLEYYCIYLSSHPLIELICDWYLEIMKNRKIEFKKHDITPDEISLLWMAKDNVVKLNISLLYIYSKWQPILLSVVKKEKEKFGLIIEDIFKDFDLAFSITRGQFLQSIRSISIKHPDIIGLLWELASHRTRWSNYTRRIDSFDSFDEGIGFTRYYWISPVLNKGVISRMRGFYSSMHSLLKHYSELGEDIENSLDWAFSKLVKPEE